MHTYKHKNISKEWKISFCCLGRLNYCKYFNLFCTYTIWLFTAFAQINTSNAQQVIFVDTLLGNGTSPSILDRKIKWSEAFQSKLMATSIGFSSLIGIIYSIVYSNYSDFCKFILIINIKSHKGIFSSFALLVTSSSPL